MHVLVKLGLALILVVGGAAALVAFHGQPQAAVAPAPPVPVVTVPVQQRDAPIVLTGLGTVQALNAATIRSQVAGTLQRVTFTEGQPVKRGDALAEIDPRPYQARLEQAQAQLARDQAQLANVQVNLNRNLPLLSRGFATDQQVADQRSQVTQLQSTLKSDQAAIDDAQTQLSYTTLTAPFDGITGVRRLDVGNVIHPTDLDGLVTLAQVQPVAVLLTLPSANIAQVQDALAAGPVKAVAYDQVGTTALDTGQLLVVNNQADPQSGTVQLKAVFPNAQRRLWPGAFVNVELTTSVAKGALTVPAEAVQQGPNGTFAYAVGADNKATVRPIQVGQHMRGRVVVSQGLSPGETVVVQGQYRLTDGAVVAPSKPADVPGSAAATAGLLP